MFCVCVVHTSTFYANGFISSIPFGGAIETCHGLKRRMEKANLQHAKCKLHVLDRFKRAKYFTRHISEARLVKQTDTSIAD